eukprot:scaffold543_cov106-Skeletonema_marinoi.AAC.2
MAETVWSNKTFAHLREAIAQLLTKHVNVFFLYDQLEGPLSDFFKTSSTFNGNKMSNITPTLIHSAFEKPKKSNSYELYSTIFFEEEDYADYYIHVDKTNGKVACSKSESMEDIRSVDGNEASRLLCGLTIDTTLYEKVQNFLVRRHQTKDKGKRKRKVTAPKRTAQLRERLSTPSSTNRPTSASSVQSGTSARSPDPKKHRHVVLGNDSTAAGVVSAGLSSAVSNDEDDKTPSASKSIKDLLYGADGKLRAEVIEAISQDKEYMLLKRIYGMTNRQMKYSMEA